MSTPDIKNFDNWTPEEFPTGMVNPVGGSSKLYITGGWRSDRPVWTAQNCKHCMLCWVNCPDSSILVENGTMTGIDFDHCKGCGVCAVECRFDAIHMVAEHDEEV